MRDILPNDERLRQIKSSTASKKVREAPKNEPSCKRYKDKKQEFKKMMDLYLRN